MSKKVLAVSVLDMPNHLSIYLLVHALFCVWPHCLRALMLNLFAGRKSLIG